MSNDNQFLVSISDKIRLWNLHERRQEGVLHCISNAEIKSLIVTANNSIAFIQIAEGLKVWNYKDNTLESFQVPNLYSSSCISISNDLQYIAIGRDTQLILWDIKNQRQEALFHFHQVRAGAVHITSDNKFIVSVDSFTRSLEKRMNAVRIWSLQEKTQVAALFGHTQSIRTLAVASDSTYIATASDDNTLRIWSFKELKQVAMIKKSRIQGLVITRDSKYVIYCNHFTIFIYSIRKQTLENFFPNNSVTGLLRDISSEVSVSSHSEGEK